MLVFPVCLYDESSHHSRSAYIIQNIVNIYTCRAFVGLGIKLNKMHSTSIKIGQTWFGFTNVWV